MLTGRSLPSTLPFVQGVCLRKFPLCIRFLFPKSQQKESQVLLPFLIPYEDMEDLGSDWLFRKRLGMEDTEGQHCDAQCLVKYVMKSETALLIVDPVWLDSVVRLLEESVDSTAMRRVVEELFVNCAVVILQNVSSVKLPTATLYH